MVTSSSDSDSDDYEPVRKIQINIRPKGEVSKRSTADVSEIKASVQAWRPLGPPTHPSLSRRQSSLSSMSSMSFGTGSVCGGGSSNIAASSSSNANITTNRQSSQSGLGGSMHSSPSCSSLVSEFNNRSSFAPNFISRTTSRTSSPLNLLSQASDSVPIAIAIQESIELVIKGIYDPNSMEPKYQTRSFGNIKVAFPNAFAAKCSNNLAGAILKLKMHSIERINKYYASGLIKDLDLETNDSIVTRQIGSTAFQATNSRIVANNLMDANGSSQDQPKDLFTDLLDMSPQSTGRGSKKVEFDMKVLTNQLKKMYEQSPRSRYFTKDVLRYYIDPIKSIEDCPLQVCAYWKLEPKLIRLRVDFKHSAKSGLPMDNFREISFSVNLANLIPGGLDVNSLSPNTMDNLRLSDNNNDLVLMNKNNPWAHSATRVDNDPTHCDQAIGDPFGVNFPVNGGPKTSNPGPPSNMPHSKMTSNQLDAFKAPINQTFDTQAIDEIKSISKLDIIATDSCNTPSTNPATAPPYLTHKPLAHWNSSIKQLIWKFDDLSSFKQSNREINSLMAKLDLRCHQGASQNLILGQSPPPVEVKFVVVDSNLSGATMSVDSPGYRVSTLKREIRSGRYRSEPYVL